MSIDLDIERRTVRVTLKILGLTLLTVGSCWTLIVLMIKFSNWVLG